MITIAKNIIVKDKKALRMIVTPGFACSGMIVVELFDKNEDAGIFDKIIDLEQGKVEFVIPNMEEEVTDYILAGYGKARPLPGKSEVRVAFKIMEGDKELIEFSVSKDESFKFMVLPKTDG